MRMKPRLDGNHTQVVDALTKAGIKVQSLASIGGGCPDLLCGWRGVNVVLELKDEEKPLSAQSLTAMERNWHAAWPGQVSIANSPEGAIVAVINAVSALVCL